MARRKAKEINVYSTSAIDLFASGMGVFLFLTILILPKIKNESRLKIDEYIKQMEQLSHQLSLISEAKDDYLLSMKKRLQGSETAIKMTPDTQDDAAKQVTATYNQTRKVVDDLIQKLSQQKKQEDSIRQKMQELVKKMKQEQSKNVVLKTQQEKLRQQKQELQSQLEKSVATEEKFVAVILNWFTERHDLDLRIEGPDGKKYIFNKADSNQKSQIISDAREGPGTEVWYLSKPAPGTYKVFVMFHEKYGNDKPAELGVNVFNNSNFISGKRIQLSKSLTEYEVGEVLISDGEQIQYSSFQP
ncbi:MAG: hypothetical protein CL674_16775 [Bdellovibrionaceae bacterium]|nr:hypothetical protein [Pseudobdellovibrionaceae bacterium]